MASISTAIPSGQMRALHFYDKGDIRLEHVPVFSCGLNDVRIKIAYCGICGSDIHEFLGGPIYPPQHGTTHKFSGAKLPVIMGHEFSGTVVEVGSNAATSSPGLQVGQKVGVNPALDHRHYGGDPCSMCMAGRHNICSGTATYGMSAPGGGFADEIVVDARNCIPLPDNIDLRTGALLEPLAVAHHCVATSGFRAGQTVLVCGAGPIGLAILALLKAKGAKTVVVTEVSAARSEQARRFGADAVVNPLLKTEQPTGEAVQEGGSKLQADPALAAVESLTDGEGVDVTFDATGLQSTLDLCLAAVRTGGTVFMVALHERPLLINPNSFTLKEARVTGGICYVRDDFMAVLGLLEQGKLKADDLITAVVSLDDVVDKGFGELINHKERQIKILIQP